MGMKDLRIILKPWRYGRQEYKNSDFEATRGRFIIKIPGMPGKNISSRYAITNIYEDENWHLVKLKICEKGPNSNRSRFRVPTMPEIFRIRSMIFEPDAEVLSCIDYTHGRKYLDTKHFNLWQNKTKNPLPIPKSYTLHTPTMTLKTHET